MSAQPTPATPNPRPNPEAPIPLAREKPPQTPAESFVDADSAAEFLAITRRQLLELARSGIIPAYPANVGTRRRLWRFRLSEIANAIMSNTNIPVGRRQPVVNNGSRQSP
jgi:hypothetical protein